MGRQLFQILVNRIRNLDSHEYRLTAWLFLRGLGIIYFIAFASLAAQILGLVGENGILPIGEYLQTVANAYPKLEAILRFPTLLWLDSSDTFLLALCWAGCIVSLLLTINIFPAITASLSWGFYLSLVIGGQVFMGFQWDSLLLECGFLAIFLAPIYTNPRHIAQYESPKIIIWLLRWLLFRLMLSSGLVKFLSGDNTWANWTALEYYFETQPIPNVIAWYVHHLPAWMLQFGTVATLFIELFVPILYFSPRPLRWIAATLTIILQVIILLTGNYAFFNWLTILLALTLFDDSLFSRLIRPQNRSTQPHHIKRIVIYLFAISILFLSSFKLIGQMTRQTPEFIVNIRHRIAPFRIINNYGLFAVMTTNRPIIIVEGSEDGETWIPYEWHFQSDKLDEMPPMAAPYHPRLDWQVWFAGLNPQGSRVWLSNLVNRLLEGSSDVLDLFGSNPFPDSPPQMIRVQIYNYRFSDDSLRQQGIWWERELTGTYIQTQGS